MNLSFCNKIVKGFSYTKNTLQNDYQDAQLAKLLTSKQIPDSNMFDFLFYVG